MRVLSTPSGVVVQPVGDLDAEGCAAVRRVLSTALSTGVQNVVLDLSEVTHLELEAVQLLRGVQQYLNRLGGGLVVTKPSAAAERGLRANDLIDLLALEDIPVPQPALRSVKAG